MIKNKAISEKINLLEKQYRKDEEALAEIARAKETILYYEGRGEDQKAQAEVKQLEAFLHDWY